MAGNYFFTERFVGIRTLVRGDKFRFVDAFKIWEVVSNDGSYIYAAPLRSSREIYIPANDPGGVFLQVIRPRKRR